MTNTRSRAGSARRRRTAGAVAVLTAGTLVAAVPASLASAHPAPGDGGSVKTVVDGLDGARGLAVARHGKLVVTESNGNFSLVYPGHRRHDRHDGGSGGDAAKIVKLGTLVPGFANAVDVGRHGTVWLLTGVGAPGTGAATLYKWHWGDAKPQAFADIGAYQANDPDPYDLEKNPTDSNPFGVAALGDGSVLVADAGGNDLLRVKKDGSIETVARLKPRTVKVPDGLPATLPGEDGGPDLTVPPAGTPIPAEAVATSVTVGPDGAWYVGELRGFPATPGTSEIWRIEPGTVGAVCDPEKPDTGSCTRYADGLTSIMDLGARSGYGDHGRHDGRGGAIYAVEMSKMSWLKAELQVPGSDVGALIKVSHDGHKLRELAKDQLHLPGGVAVGDDGSVSVAGPVFGPGGVVRVRH